MDSTRLRSLLAAGAVASVSAGVVFYIMKLYFGKKYDREINRLHLSITQLQTEVASLRATVDGEGDGSVRRIRRRGLRSNSGYLTDQSDGYSLDTEDDDEFFDLTDDEERAQSTMKQNATNEGTEETDAFFKEVDTLIRGDGESHSKALSLLIERRDDFKYNVDFLWRTTKVYRLHASSADGDKEKKRQFVEEGLKYGRQAVELEPGHGEANKWYAILLGMRNEFLPMKDKIDNGVKFQKHLELALEKKPTDYSLFYLLGMFKYEIASLTWWEKKAASTLFGALPNVTADDAFDDASQAERLSPHPWADNRVLLAKCCFSKSDYSNGVDWLEKARDALTDLPQNLAAKNEIEHLLTKYSKYRL